MAKTKRKLMTRAAYAKLNGVAARTVGKYVQKKVIPLHKDAKGRLKLIDADEADRLLKDHLVNPFGSGRQAPGYKRPETTADPVEPADVGTEDGRADTFVEARTKEKRLKNEILQLDLQLKRGQMVLTKDVELAAFNSARQVRDKMLNIPDRVAAILAAETDELKVRTYLMKEIEGEINTLVQQNYGS